MVLPEPWHLNQDLRSAGGLALPKNTQNITVKGIFKHGSS